MENNEIYKLKERIRALREDFEDLRNLLRSTEDEVKQADIETEMNRIQDLISALSHKLKDKMDERNLIDNEAQM